MGTMNIQGTAEMALRGLFRTGFDAEAGVLAEAAPLAPVNAVRVRYMVDEEFRGVRKNAQDKIVGIQKLTGAQKHRLRQLNTSAVDIVLDNYDLGAHFVPEADAEIYSEANGIDLMSRDLSFMLDEARAVHAALVVQAADALGVGDTLDLTDIATAFDTFIRRQIRRVQLSPGQKKPTHLIMGPDGVDALSGLTQVLQGASISTDSAGKAKSDAITLEALASFLRSRFDLTLVVTETQQRSVAGVNSFLLSDKAYLVYVDPANPTLGDSTLKSVYQPVGGSTTHPRGRLPVDSIFRVSTRQDSSNDRAGMWVKGEMRLKIHDMMPTSGLQIPLTLPTPES